MRTALLGFTGCLICLGPALAQPNPANPLRPHLVYLLDVSGSMVEGDRLPNTRAAAKLGLRVVGSANVTMVRFSSDAVVSPMFTVPGQMAEAEAWIDGLTAGGDTRYLAALTSIPPGNVNVVCLSDGMPSEPSVSVLKYVRENVQVPLHTIAMETVPEAEQVLATIAAATEGGFYRVRESAEVVDAFLEILGQSRQFRRHEFPTGSLQLTGVLGELMAIGFDVVPEFSGAGQVDRHEAELPGGRVHVARTMLASSQDIEIHAPAGPSRSPGRVIALRFDLAVAAMNLSRLETSVGQSVLRAETLFRDLQGSPLSPDRLGAMHSHFEVLDSQGNILQSADAVAAPGDSTMLAILPLADGVDVPLVVRNTTRDSTSGAAFTAMESRAVELATLPVTWHIDVRTQLETAPVTVASDDPLICLATIHADSSSAEAISQFRQAFATQPPVVEVIMPDGRRVDSSSQPQAFDIRPVTRAEGLAFEIEFKWADIPGNYEVAVVEGQVGEVQYPGAIAHGRRLPGDSLQLLVVSHRSRGKVVLYDSLQSGSRYALVGDPLACEIVRGSLDPRVFVGLAGGLKARFLGADGAVQTVPLRFDRGRYTTDSVPFDQPGVLTVEVDLATPGLKWSVLAQVKIEQLTLDLDVGGGLLTRGPGTLPVGALVPFEVQVKGQRGGEPASRDDLLEVASRQQARLTWALKDSSDRILQQGGQPAEEALSCSARVQLQRTGRQVLDIELVGDGDQVLTRVRRAFDVVPAVVRFAVAQRGGDGLFLPLKKGSSLARSLPGFLVARPSAVIIAEPTSSPLSGVYFLAGLSVGDREAPFVVEQGCFVLPLAEDSSGVHDCLARLQPHDFGADAVSELPEIQVLESIPVELPLTMRWGRLVSLGATLCCATGLVFMGWRQQRFTKLAAQTMTVHLWTLDAQRSLSMVSGHHRPWWPRAAVFVCRVDGELEQYELVYPGHRRAELIEVARVCQRVDGTVSVQAKSDLAELRENETRLLSLGDACLQISETASMAVGFSSSAMAGAKSAGTAALISS